MIGLRKKFLRKMREGEKYLSWPEVLPALHGHGRLSVILIVIDATDALIGEGIDSGRV